MAAAISLIGVLAGTAFAYASIQRNDASLTPQPTGPIDPCGGVKADVTILGDLAPGPVWVVNGKILPNNGTVSLKAGQVVCFGIKAGTHGLLFPSQAAGQSVFDIAASPQASKFIANPRGASTCGQSNTFGTVPQGSGVIAILRVLDSVTLATPAPFECSQHCANMAGAFTVDGLQDKPLGNTPAVKLTAVLLLVPLRVAVSAAVWALFRIPAIAVKSARYSNRNSPTPNSSLPHTTRFGCGT